MKTIQLTLITPHQRYHVEDGDLVIVPTKQGEEGFMYQHVPTIVSVVPGVLRYRFPHEETGHPTWRYIFVSAGYAEISPEQVTVLTTAAEFVADIDVDRARQSLKRGEQRIAKPMASKIDKVHGKHAIRRAKARIHAYERYGQEEGSKRPSALTDHRLIGEHGEESSF